MPRITWYRVDKFSHLRFSREREVRSWAGDGVDDDDVDVEDEACSGEGGASDSERSPSTFSPLFTWARHATPEVSPSHLGRPQRRRRCAADSIDAARPLPIPPLVPPRPSLISHGEASLDVDAVAELSLMATRELMRALPSPAAPLITPAVQGCWFTLPNTQAPSRLSLPRDAAECLLGPFAAALLPDRRRRLPNTPLPCRR